MKNQTTTTASTSAASTTTTTATTATTSSTTTLLFMFVCFSLFICSGCATLRTLLPGGPTMADAEWSGVKSGEPIPITGSVTTDQQSVAVVAILQVLKRDDPLGVLLPVTMIGETQPRWILCTDDLVAKCRAIPLNAKVHFSGQALGPGILWQPHHLTADDFND